MGRVSSPTFVGRSEQLQALHGALSRAAAGQAGAVFIAGDAGVGKSRLVMEFERVVLEREGRFLLGGCVDVGGSELPYAPVLAALRALTREIDRTELEELVGARAAELGRLLPELAVGTVSHHAVDPLAQSRLFEALLGLFAGLGESGPVVLVIEDLQWADPSTRGFLSFLVRNIRRERLLLVATYRSDDLHRRHPLRRVLAEVERVPAVERLGLEPFTRRELAEQLAAILEATPDHALVEELFVRSQGNAFFAEELLAASDESVPQLVPQSLRDALTLRVERLSPQAQQTVSSAAVAGSLVGHRLLAATVGLGDHELLDALHEAIENNVLVPDPASESYTFRHDLLRDALYDELLPRERVALHAALAAALEVAPDLAVGAHGAAAQRAVHWSAAHELANAIAASVEAGIEAERVWSFAEANGHFEQAIELWDRVEAGQRPDDISLVDLVGRAAEAAYLSGQSPRAVTLTRSALEMIDPDQDPMAAAIAHSRLGRYLLADYLQPEALIEYRAAAALAPAEPTAARASILAGEAHILMLEGEAAQARAPCEEAVRIAREVGAAELECDALNTLGAVLAILGAPEDAIDVLRRGKQLAEDLGAPEELRRAYINLGQSLDHAGRLDEAAAVAREGWEQLRPRIGSAAWFLVAEAGGRLKRLGRWDEASALLREAAETARPHWTTALVLDEFAELQALRGELEPASASMERARQQRHGDIAIGVAKEGVAAAALAFARGDPGAVRLIVDVDTPARQSDPAFDLPPFVYALRAEAELARQARMAGDPGAERAAVARAQALLSRVQRLSAPDTRPLGHPPADMLLEIELCELEGRRAGGDTNADAWAAHADRWEQLGRPFHAAYAHLREAEAALAESMPRARIVEPLAAARATARRLGAQPLLAEIEAVSRRARLRSAHDEPEAVPDEVEGLTKRELDVLRLIAAGRTNPEIGKELYISPKTASVHVSRILTKLDVKTRTEAAGVAYRLGLLDGP
ncbi:MAG TPA: AAA family ATPase [Solirubrobacteraceae bacterium]|nr:AAA family ATPase [Solirubrobacteraceae bacterium]